MSKEDRYSGLTWDQLSKLTLTMKKYDLSFRDVLEIIDSPERRLTTARKRYEEAKTRLNILEDAYGKDKQNYPSSDS